MNRGVEADPSGTTLRDGTERCRKMLDTTRGRRSVDGAGSHRLSTTLVKPSNGQDGCVVIGIMFEEQIVSNVGNKLIDRRSLDRGRLA